MSIQVELSTLADTVTRYRFAYLLTVGAAGPPHAVAVMPRIDGGVFTVEGLGRRTRSNLCARPVITLVWPPESLDGYSLIVDGETATDGDSVRITPMRAVLHRPARRPEPVTEGACGSDCIELPLPAGSTATEPK
ncbi:MAG: hypothetical protein J5I81_11620 [Nitrococcus mobilis]|nr:hypothetical protein [Nitrococcus mobilis]